ncbi:MAG: hypothetical protein KJP21_08760 [Bacteroidia bacterium]|nr:hypothetical protein [Bacteroidia bacterium]NNJ55603.1 hypothetical protein [Bacteroidia bacterium]
MDNLEKFIKENKEQFNLEEPRADMWDKINKDRQKENIATKRRFILPYKSMRLAASILILALAAFGTYKLVSPEIVPVVAESTNLPQELIEMDHYYEAQVNTYVSQVKNVVHDEELLEEIENDLALLNIEKEQLFKDYGTEIDDEEVVQALISTYRMKIQILEDILKLLNEHNNEQAI